jgi:hypothetical protein
MKFAILERFSQAAYSVRFETASPGIESEAK